MKRAFFNNLATGLALCVGAAGFAVPALSQAGGLKMLESIAKGEWTVKYRDGTPNRKVCIRTGRELIQLRHKDAGCNRFVVDDTASKVTVHYTCPGNGYGRTSIRRETGNLVQIESQGIEAGLPFQLAAEARLTGTCR